MEYRDNAWYDEDENEVYRNMTIFEALMEDRKVDGEKPEVPESPAVIDRFAGGVFTMGAK